MVTFKDLNIGDNVYRLSKDYALVILKVNNIINYENGALDIDLVFEEGKSFAEIDLRPYDADRAEYLYFVNGDDYWFYSDPIACSHAISCHIQHLSNMIVNFTNIKDQLMFSYE